jgi:hypothetical protein
MRMADADAEDAQTLTGVGWISTHWTIARGMAWAKRTRSFRCRTMRSTTSSTLSPPLPELDVGATACEAKAYSTYVRAYVTSVSGLGSQTQTGGPD